MPSRGFKLMPHPMPKSCYCLYIALRQVIRTLHSYADISLEGADILTLLCDISQVNSRPIVPGPFHREVFNIIFNLPHPGRVILSGHVLCGIGNSRCPSMDTNLYVVPAAKIRRHTTVPLQRFDLPDGRFEDTHVDIITLYLH
jgi:hypothetical protein